MPDVAYKQSVGFRGRHGSQREDRGAAEEGYCYSVDLHRLYGSCCGVYVHTAYHCSNHGRRADELQG